MHEDAVWDALARALAGEYEIVARFGLGGGGAPVYLARELMTDSLVALRLPPLVSGGDAREFGLEVVRQIDSSLPEIEAKCRHCSATIRHWSRLCPRCGKDISGLAPAGPDQTREELRRLARSAAAGRYDTLGDMSRVEGGGMVYFARELASGQIVALTLESGTDGPRLTTAAAFAPSDPSIEIPEARHPSGEQIARRTTEPTGRVLSVPRFPKTAPAAGQPAVRKPRPSAALRVGLIGSAILVLILIGLFVYRSI